MRFIGPIPQITTTSIPAANQNQPYSVQFQATGGIYPVTWSAVITPNTGGQFSLDPASGILSGTPPTVETETITVTATDSMSVKHNSAVAVFTLPVNSAVTVTTASLPNGTAGTFYSAGLNAMGGTSPYTWAMSPTPLNGLTLNAGTGVLSGTPTTNTTVTGNFTATDLLGIPSAPAILTLTTQTTGATPVPQAMWDGYQDTSSVLVSWWYPSAQTTWVTANFTGSITGNVLTVTVLDTKTPGTIAVGQSIFGHTTSIAGSPRIASLGTGTGGLGTYNLNGSFTSASQFMYTGLVDYYNIYRDGAQIGIAAGQPAPPGLTAPGVTGDPVPPQGSGAGPNTNFGDRPLYWFVDRSLAAGATHTYTVSAVIGGVESAQSSPALTMSTLANGASVSPTPPTAVTTWQQPFALPTGTTWPVTVGTADPGGTIPGTLQNALNSANINGGDIIVITAGLQCLAPTNSNGFVFPAFTGSNGWTYIISSEDPVLKPGGSLIPYSYNSSNYGFTNVTCTANIAAGNTSATLTAVWPNKTGWYYVLFTTPTLSSIIPATTTEERLVKFTNNSAQINWLVDGTHNLNPLYPTNGISTVGAPTPGSGYTPKLNSAGAAIAYNAVSLTGGTGVNACADSILVSLAGQVVTCTIDPLSGSGYTIGDVLTCPASSIGGTGSGFSVTVTAVAGRGAGLTVAGNATIQVAYLTGVTPTDRTAMPTLVFGVPSGGLGGTGVTLPAAISKVRFVGINIQPTLGVQLSELIAVKFANESPANAGTPAATPAESVYFDRCIIGNDTNDPGWQSVVHGLSGINCNHLQVSQCYFWGICNDFISVGGHPAAGVGDSNNNVTGGGDHLWQNNYFQTGAESIIYGGSYVSRPPNTPHDITIRNNMSHRPRSWIQGYPQVAAGVGWFWGEQTKDHFELKCGIRAEYYGNLILNNWMGVIQSYHSSAFAFTARDQQWLAALATDITQTCPWGRVTDVSVHDNQCYYIGSLFYTLTGDPTPSTYAQRVKVTNNILFMSPWLAGTYLQERPRAILTNGPLSDLIIDHNTIICNSGAPTGAVGPPFGMLFSGGGTAAGTIVNPHPYTPNPYSSYQDRFTFTNNIIDSGVNVPGSTSAIAVVAPGITLDKYKNDSSVVNLVCNKNLTISDATVYGTTPGGTYFPGTFSNKAYNTLGMANFQGNTAPPLNPSDWNITSGTYATAGTDGRPLGASFGVSLAADPFPRTRWQVIQPSASVYAGATFQANAAKFNIVDFGPFMGIEQQGVNFATVFQNIKAASTANGFPTPTRCLHYVNSWVSAPVPGQSGGNTSTFTSWETAVNSANWWLRTSYPAGTIVKSTFGGETVNTGVTAITSANNVTFQPTGATAPLTIGQGFWFHYDGVLRLGNAVSQGYASNLAFVANPFLDGYQMDNIFAKTRVAGSYTMNTTSQAVGDNAASALNQQGEAQQVAALKAINPNLLVMGNCDYFVHSTSANNPVTTLDPSQVGIWDMVYCQVVVGPGGIDGFVSNSQAVGMLIAAEAQMAPTGTLIFEQTGRGPGAVNWTSASQASWTSGVGGDWQAARFGQAMCFMRNYHYALNANENYSPSSPYFTDEYSPQGGVYGWLGKPIDPPQSAARTSGVWWRKFTNGVIFWNPAGNGVQTLTLASLGLASGLKAIAHVGFGDAAINTGLAVTSVTLQDRDGRFLIGAP